MLGASVDAAEAWKENKREKKGARDSGITREEKGVYIEHVGGGEAPLVTALASQCPRAKIFRARKDRANAKEYRYIYRMRRREKA